MTASLCSLKDPRHGGANTKVVQMMADLRSRVRDPADPEQVRQYLNRISGPLLDRFDLHIEVEPVSFDSLSAKAKAESSSLFSVYIAKKAALCPKRN